MDPSQQLLPLDLGQQVPPPPLPLPLPLAQTSPASTATSSVGSSSGSGSGSGNGSVSANGSNPGVSVPAACLACRNKHLKCDGQRPCHRCVSAGADPSECQYIASRRGYKGPRRSAIPPSNPNKRRAASSPSSTDNETLVSSSTSPTTSCSTSTTVFLPFPANPAPLPERAFEAFYTHYHAAHPFILPRAHLLRYIHASSSSTTTTTPRKFDPLLAAIRYAGSLFLAPAADGTTPNNNFLDDALHLCLHSNAPEDGYLVQALLLLLVALDGSGQQARARELLALAERLAVALGMHTRAFAAVHGGGDAVLEESWRRTWWDLYVCDGMIAGVHRMTQFLLYDVVEQQQQQDALALLPLCEEAEYRAGRVPAPPVTVLASSLADMEDDVFLHDGDDDSNEQQRGFTSFAYRVAAMRNLGRFMRSPPILFPQDANLARMQGHLTNWRLHLPRSKQDPLDAANGEPDEMLFQAHFITTAITIMLHQPHSQLDASPARAITSCAPYKPVVSGSAPYNMHTQHTITAAHAISQMITHPQPPLTHHTHFFTCVITMAAIVHLSKWALYFVHDDTRDEIRLAIGALAALSATWAAAGCAGAQVKAVAQAIYRTKKAQQMNPAFWVAFSQEEMLASLHVDEAVMTQIELLAAVPAVE